MQNWFRTEYGTDKDTMTVLKANQFNYLIWDK